MTNKQEKAYTKASTKFYNIREPLDSDLQAIFEAGIKAGQEEREIVWHDEKTEPQNAGLYLTYGRGGLGIQVYDGERWDSIYIAMWAEIPAWLRPPAPQDNGSKAV